METQYMGYKDFLVPHFFVFGRMCAALKELR